MVLKPGGEMIPVIKSVVPVTMGERKCLIESFTDITERKRLEAQLQHVQKMEAIGTLAGGVAHDFNNILTAIIGYAHILLMKMGKDDPLRTNIDQILASSNRAANLTQGLLAFSRKQAIDTRPVEVNEIVRSVEKLLLQVIGEDIEFRTFFTETPLVVMADKGQIEQVLMNLCTNARDAMPHGGILSISMEMIRLDSEFINMHGYGKKGDYAHISVVDTGVGMDDITKEKIFEPFFTTKEVGKGTGLGMAIVYGIIKQHNGFIDIYSAIGKGSTFNIYLPLIKAKSVDDEKIAEDIIAGGTETILFAEDDTVVRGLIAEVLTDSGYKVIEAINGEDAVRKFKEHGPAISLLLFDVIMPKKHGVDAYLEILPERPDIKVLFISGYSRDVIQMRWVHEHGHQCLQKPISPAELQKKLREILDEKQGEIS
jgi:signal transduction histidine kinase/ActR/RegA family two-component response regulator